MRHGIGLGLPSPATPRAGWRRALKVVLGGAVIAETTRGHRVLETSHPPGYYFPLADVAHARAGCLARPWVALRVEGRRVLLRPRRWRRPADRARRLDVPRADARASRRSATRLRSTRRPWTSAPSTASWSPRSRVASTAAGSPRTSWARSRARRGRWAGSACPAPPSHRLRCSRAKTRYATAAQSEDREPDEGQAWHLGGGNAPVRPLALDDLLVPHVLGRVHPAVGEHSASHRTRLVRIGPQSPPRAAPPRGRAAHVKAVMVSE